MGSFLFMERLLARNSPLPQPGLEGSKVHLSLPYPRTSEVVSGADIGQVLIPYNRLLLLLQYNQQRGER